MKKREAFSCYRISVSDVESHGDDIMKMEPVARENAKRPLMWVRVLIVVATAVAVAITIFLGEQTFRETKKLATEQFNRQQLLFARLAASGIEEHICEASSSLEAMANLPYVQRMEEQCLPCVQHTYYGSSNTLSQLLDEKGISRFVYPHNQTLLGKDCSGEDYFREVKQSGHTKVQVVFDEQGRLRLRIAVPVYLRHKMKTITTSSGIGMHIAPLDKDAPGWNRFCGVLVGLFDTQAIFKHHLSSITSGSSGYAWLINEKGMFVSHYEENFIGHSAFSARAKRNPDISYQTIEDIQRKMLAGEERTGRYVSGWHRDKNGEMEKLIAYAPVRVDDKVWSLAVCVPVGEVEEVVRAAKRSELYTLGFIILVLVAGGVLLLAISRKWSHRLEHQVQSRTGELKETSDYLSRLIRYANAPIIVWNPDGKITIFNKAFEEMSGRREVEMLGNSLDVLFPSESRSESMSKIGISRGQHWENVEVPILHKDGTVHMGLWNSANIYADDDNKVLIATVAQGWDITERRQAKEETTKLEAQLRQAVKMEAIGRLAGGIAHDFNNMLAIIQGYADLLLKDMREDDRKREDVESIRTAAKRAAALTRQLLAFGRKQTIQPKVLDLNEIIADADSMLQRIIGEDIEMETIPGKNLWRVKVDPDQIEEQVILNLTVNAREAMPGGGKLTIETTNVTLDENYTHWHANVNAGDYVVLAVSDTGIGMSEDVMSNIFEPFFTTKESNKSSGLGLSTVYGIVKQSDGYIWVYSEPGKGTTFKIYFPRVDAPIEYFKQEYEPGVLPRGTETILMAEDEPSVRAVNCRILREQGYTVLEVPDGNEAMLVAEKFTEGKIHLLITDVVMPYMSGKDLADRMKTVHSSIKVLFVSGYTDNAIVHHGVLDKGVNFLAKPFSPHRLARTVRRILDTK